LIRYSRQTLLVSYAGDTNEIIKYGTLENRIQVLTYIESHDMVSFLSAMEFFTNKLFRNCCFGRKTTVFGEY
jgi:hypothetical protein